MRRQNEGRLSERLILTGILGCVVLAGIPLRRVEAATISWPALNPKAPCGNFLGGLGLNDCIDQVAQPGDVVQVRTNNPIQEDVTIGKSLTLQASPGFAPILGPLHYIFLSNVGTDFSTVVVEDFTLQQGRIFAVQASLSDFHVTLRNLTIQNTFNDGPEIQIRTGQPGPFAPVFFDISNNHLTVPVGQYLGAEAISVEGGNAQRMTGVIRNNRIDHFHGGQQGAIGLYNLAANPFDVDVIANEIRGSNYNYGVNFFQFGGGSGVLRYLDNLVVGQVNVAGAPGAYVINVSDGNAAFEIVNNTAADGGIGILINGRDDLGASWSGIVANNIVANMSGGGIQVGQPTQTSGIVDNDHNLVHSVAFNDFIAGPGTVFANPLFFAGGTDYHLAIDSPARNSGNAARVPIDLVTDLVGNPRQVGIVDMGAYEAAFAPTCDGAGTGPAWPACGVQAGIASGQGFAPGIADSEPDGAGGAFVSWNRNGDVYLQHLTATGARAPGWPANGVAVCTLFALEGGTIVPDGAGGAFVVWMDGRNGENHTFLQHITASGAVSPGWPVNGRVLVQPVVPGSAVASSDESAVSNGSGGVIVASAFGVSPSSTPNILQCVTASGSVAPGWPATGVQVPFHIRRIASDGAGGAFAVGVPSFGGALRVLRVSASGSIAPGWPAAGFAPTTPISAQFEEIQLTTDLSGGVIVVFRPTSTASIRAQRVLSTAAVAPGWPADGVLVSTAVSFGPGLQVDSDGAGGCLVAWTNQQAARYVIVQRVTGTGGVASGWPANGVQVANVPDDGSGARVSRDGMGGAFVTWSSGDGPAPPDMKATRISPVGVVAPGWNTGGTSLGTNVVANLSCVGDGCTGAIASWVSVNTVRAMRLQAAGHVPECFSVPALFPGTVLIGPVTVTYNNFYGGSLALETSSTGPAPPSGFQLVPAAPPLYYDLTAAPSLPQPATVCIHYDPTAVVGSEDNLVLLHYDETAQPPAWVDVTTSRDPANDTLCGLSTFSPFVIAELEPTDTASTPKPVFALRQNVPNPFNPTTTIEFGMSERGWVRLGIFDVGGRLVRMLVQDVRDAGVHRVLWRGNDSADKRCSSGVYFYRIETAQGVLTRRMVLVR